GTRAYLSPEQARFESNKVDGRSDIFSLGVIFYQLLTGVRPFEGRTPDECLRAILVSEPRPLRARDASIPRELERICLKCLEKRMGDRYLTAGDLAEDLKRWLNASAIPSGSATMPLPEAALATGKQRSQYGLAIAMAAIGLGILSAVYLMLTGGRSSSVPPSPTEREFMTTFGQSPKKLPYEGSRGVGSFRFIDEPTLSALAVESDTVTLIELCRMPAEDFEF